jgi:hypothetical protein
MDDGELHVLKYDCLHGGKDEIEKTFRYIKELRNLLCDLMECLDDNKLRKRIEQVMGLEGPEITI